MVGGWKGGGVKELIISPKMDTQKKNESGGKSPARFTEMQHFMQMYANVCRCACRCPQLCLATYCSASLPVDSSECVVFIPRSILVRFISRPTLSCCVNVSIPISVMLSNAAYVKRMLTG